MKYILHPISVILFSILIGGVSNAFKKSLWLACLLPPLVVILLIGYHEFSTPYKGGGFDFWPIAMIVAGGIASVSGCIGYCLTNLWRNR